MAMKAGARLFARVVKVTGFELLWLQGLLEWWGLDFLLFLHACLPSSRKAGFLGCQDIPTLYSLLDGDRQKGYLESPSLGQAASDSYITHRPPSRAYLSP